MSHRLTLGDIAAQLQVELRGDAAFEVSGLAEIQHAGPDQLAFLANPKYARHLAATQAGAVIVHPKQADQWHGHALISSNPYLTYAHAARLFDQRPHPEAGVHPRAVVAESAAVGSGTYVAANAVIEEGTVIGNDCYIGPGTVVGRDARVGHRCRLEANVTLYHKVTIGDDVIIHSGAVIGSDGFGFAQDKGQWVKICQNGSVVIGNRVEIGANTTIDRGALGDTVIEDGVILDNHIQIAHNVRVGENSALAAFVGISGSSKIGKNSTLAGMAGVVGHVELCDGVHIAGRGTVSNSISEPGAYGGIVPLMDAKSALRNAVRFTQLDAMAKRLKQLEDKDKQTDD